ncbi:MAG: hypothetical protein COV66_07515 [Nitrospinae bacterium CG11_big_fil_rev_8_21_14_0_20_45_15]|nr:MAG: hypothetical protein COV66_07515 [Nitrospinae bacterium CG11_big_fil_rev_8_21_14_0_20_45_15]
MNPPYLCNPDPQIKTGDLFRFLAGELDAFQGNEAPNALDLPSLEKLLDQLKDRVTVKTDKYSKTPAIPTDSTSVTLNDCYTDAEWKLFQSTFGQVACNWLKHFNAPHLCSPELQQAANIPNNTAPVIILNGPVGGGGRDRDSLHGRWCYSVRCSRQHITNQIIVRDLPVVTSNPLQIDNY